MVQLKQQWLANDMYAKKCPYDMRPTTITVHNTANDASALNEVRYMSTNLQYVSFHTAIDDDMIVQAIPYNRNAFHAGDGKNGAGNRTSISIEICYSKSGGPRYAQAEENAVQYIAHLLYKYNWTVACLRQHYDWSQKNCPHRIRQEGRWTAFVARIQEALNVYTFSQRIDIQEVHNANAYRVQSGRYTTKEAAVKAAQQALAAGAIHYATIIGVKE